MRGPWTLDERSLLTMLSNTVGSGLPLPDRQLAPGTTPSDGGGQPMAASRDQRTTSSMRVPRQWRAPPTSGTRLLLWHSSSTPG
jgi:hypothetical protein